LHLVKQIDCLKTGDENDKYLHVAEGDAVVQFQILQPSSSPRRERENGAMATLNDREPTLSTWIIS